ncbi:MAG: flagellar biosynthesis protein FliQ [Candidatus Gastranaerophilaceae bacterium]|jgi:flagellar biosynthetic protein FliQ
MTQIEFVTLIQQTLIIILQIVSPILIVCVVVGLAISIFQAITQIQESTLTIVPKIIAGLITIIILMPWILQVFINFVNEIFARIAGMG